jgi:hypothetical protein
MKYEKPEIVIAGSALQAVQGLGKFHSGNPDLSVPQKYTVNAYEADE